MSILVEFLVKNTKLSYPMNLIMLFIQCLVKSILMQSMIIA